MPSVDYDRPWMYDAQREAIFDPARYCIIEASTKSGKTVGCMVWLLEQALAGAPGQNFWWVAPIIAQARIAYTRMVNGLTRGSFTTNKGLMTITMLNGTVMWFKSAENPDSLFGEDVYAAVVDEASRCKEEAWHAIRSTLTSTRGAARIIGNVKGRKNWAYRLARLAESGAQGMAYYKLTAYDASKAMRPDGRPLMDPGEIEDARRLLPENVFRELYLAEPSDDGGNPFGLAHIAKCIAPLSTRAPKVWGWDLAKSIDYTVGIGLDDQGSTARFERWQRPWEDTITWIKACTLRVPALVDSTGVGDPVVEALQRRDAGGGGLYEAFHFTPTSKQQLMEGLAVAIQQRAVTFPDGPIRTELEMFEYEFTRTGVRYAAPEGFHDDCVCALALAVRHRTARVRTGPVAW